MVEVFDGAKQIRRVKSKSLEEAQRADSGGPAIDNSGGGGRFITRNQGSPIAGEFWERARQLAFPLSFTAACEARLREVFDGAALRMQREGALDRQWSSVDDEKIAQADSNLEILVQELKFRAVKAGASSIDEQMLGDAIAAFSLWPFW